MLSRNGSVNIGILLAIALFGLVAVSLSAAPDQDKPTYKITGSEVFDPSLAEVTLEHKGCRYVPHVLAMQTQQTLKIINSDPTTHNTHFGPKNNPEWNQSQPPGAVAIEHRFTSPELFIPVKDNQHPWEKAYVSVFSHPFFAISSTDGSYKISGLPPGQYTIVAWHERLGEQTVDVFLAGSERKNIDFTFRAPNH